MYVGRIARLIAGVSLRDPSHIFPVADGVSGSDGRRYDGRRVGARPGPHNSLGLARKRPVFRGDTATFVAQMAHFLAHI